MQCSQRSKAAQRGWGRRLSSEAAERERERETHTHTHTDCRFAERFPARGKLTSAYDVALCFCCRANGGWTDFKMPEASSETNSCPSARPEWQGSLLHVHSSMWVLIYVHGVCVCLCSVCACVCVCVPCVCVCVPSVCVWTHTYFYVDYLRLCSVHRVRF